MNRNYYVPSEKLGKNHGEDISVEIRKTERVHYRIMNCCEETLKKTLHLIPRTIEQKV